MPSILESVKWGKNALNFLSGPMKSIKSELPAVVLIRHSEANYKNVKILSEAKLTEEGELAAIEFGTKLPNNYSYRIFHSEYPRARVTAKCIHEGIKIQNGASNVIGSQKYLIFSEIDTEKISSYLDRDGKKFQINWISGHYPTWEIESCLYLAKKAAYGILRNIGEIGSGQIDLYLTHDIIINALIFSWFGVYKPYGWSGHLDGFIMQLPENTLTFYDKDGEHEVYYPFWWTYVR